MKPSTWLLNVFLLAAAISVQADSEPLGNFRPDRDLFLPQFDSKTDVDDLHSVAGVATMLGNPRFAAVEYHAVAGAYGVQEGLYVPSPELFEQAFGENWSDAHEQREAAHEKVTALVLTALQRGGSVWVAEAGQSDFTADWLKKVIESGAADDAKHRVNVVQHSDWNESVTDPRKLAYVKAHATYHRIPDGNAMDNGTPGFKTASPDSWERVLADPANGATWQLARQIANRYNGVEARYLNESIAAGGMDFSDVAETCWIFGYSELRDAQAFFDVFLAPGTHTD